MRRALFSRHCALLNSRFLIWSGTSKSINLAPALEIPLRDSVNSFRFWESDRGAISRMRKVCRFLDLTRPNLFLSDLAMWNKTCLILTRRKGGLRPFDSGFVGGDCSPRETEEIKKTFICPSPTEACQERFGSRADQYGLASCLFPISPVVSGRPDLHLPVVRIIGETVRTRSGGALQEAVGRRDGAAARGKRAPEPRCPHRLLRTLREQDPEEATERSSDG